MKLVCLMLIVGMFSCTYQGHVTPWPENTDNRGRSFTSGKLSEIATEIIAIPLDTNSNCRMGTIKQIRRDGADLFILSGSTLYHFDRKGRFINTITSSEGCNFRVRDYVVDPVRKQLVVLGTRQAIHYFSYNGELLGKKELNPASCPWQALIKLSYYDNHIWATAQSIVSRGNNPIVACCEKWLYKFDRDFNLLEGTRLNEIELGRPCVGGNFLPELSVVNNRIYAYSPSFQKDKLLRDTLYITSANRAGAYATAQHKMAVAYNGNICPIGYENPVSMLPFKMSNRFLLSSYDTNISPERNYLFCYDRETCRSFMLDKGFDDNFYNTGLVSGLHSVDVYNGELWYSKSGKDLLDSFPERNESDNPVLFFVKLRV